MLVAGVERRLQSEIHPDATAHELFAVERLADGNGRLDLEERDDNTAE